MDTIIVCRSNARGRIPTPRGSWVWGFVLAPPQEDLDPFTREVLPVLPLMRSYEKLNNHQFNEIFPYRPIREPLENNRDFEAKF